jgi:hypothetical protein
VDLSGFLRYWSLTLAVFIIYAFMFLAALVDFAIEVNEQIAKRRAAAAGKRPAPVPPMPGKTVASTIDSPGQALEGKRRWVYEHVALPVVRDLGLHVKVLVLEDSKHHPFVQLSDGQRLVSYRVNREAVEQAMAGEPARIEEIKTFLRRQLAADFLGREEERPPRVTELQREAAAKPAPAARAVGAGTAPAAAAATPSSAPARPPAARASAPAGASAPARASAPRLVPQPAGESTEGSATAAPAAPAPAHGGGSDGGEASG